MVKRFIYTYKRLVYLHVIFGEIIDEKHNYPIYMHTSSTLKSSFGLNPVWVIQLAIVGNKVSIFSLKKSKP